MDGFKCCSVIVFFVICHLFSQGLCRQMTCTGEWEAIHRACYKFDPNHKTWQEALSSCEEDGGTLLSIGSSVEYRKIIAGLQSRIKTDEMFTWWVGLKRNPATRRFNKWLDGLPFMPRVTKWSPGEPNNRRNKEDCVEIKFDGKLNDKNCMKENAFICEMNEITQRPSFHTTAQATTVASTTKATTILTTTEALTTKVKFETTPPTTTTTTKTTTIINTPIEEIERTTRARSDINPAETTTLSSFKAYDEDLSKYRKCYNYKSIIRGRESGKIEDGAHYAQLPSICPGMEAGGLNWPDTLPGKFVELQCKSGSGKASFRCGHDPICWQSQPDVSGCASKKFKNLLEKTKAIFQQNKPIISEGGTPEVSQKPQVVEVTVNETLEVTDTLAKVTATEDVSVADVMLTSQVIKSLTNTKFKKGPRSKKDVQNIVKNVVKAGSNLVSRNKSATWAEMKKEDKVMSATTLLVAMESATVTMAEAIDEPVVIESKDENIDMELHVLDVSSPDPQPLVYGENKDENTFSIPKETLKKLSKGGLAKAVFMTHYQISDILQDKSETQEEDTNEMVNVIEPKIASYVISASLGGAEHVKLPEPISFTMKHLQEFPSNSVPLCSFLNLSEGSVGVWSQDGCKMIKTDSKYTTCECDHLTNFAILMDVQGVEMSVIHSSLLRFITLVGCIISIICLFVSWLTFNCFSSIQGERNSIHKNLVFCLFVAEILFLVGIDKTDNKLTCGLIAGFLHYFFLTAFTWMFLEGLHIICMLIQVFDAAKSRLPYYYFVGYGFPLAIVAVSAGIFHQGYGTDRYCWLTTERYFIWSFAGPVAVVLLVNSFVLIYAMTTVCRHSEYVFSGKDKSGSDMRAWIQGAMAIEVILGLTWIFGYCFISQETIALAYIFTVLNSLQGLFIFCFHCLLNKKVIKEYKRIFHITKRPASSTQTASLMKKHGASYELSHPSQSLTHSHTDSKA